MKKLTKLLILVLSLALICGIFAVAAFAEESAGETETTVTPQFVYTDKTSGEEVTVNADQAGLVQALANVKANTTITLTADAHIKISGDTANFASVGNVSTLDLGNHTLIIEQTNKTEHKISVSKSFTVQNGTLYLICTSPDAGSNDSYGKKGQTYPLFFLSGGANLTFNNLNTYAGALIYSYSSQGGTVTVNGGNHYAVFNNRGTDLSWFNTRSNVNFEAYNATFFTDGDTRIASFDATYGKVNQSTDDNGEVTLTLKPYHAIFDNCKIIGYNDSGAAAKLFNKAPSNLTAVFNNCDIYGTFSFESTSGTNKTLNKNDESLHVKFTGITAENVIFSGKTTYVNSQLTAGHTFATGDISSTLTYSQSKAITINDVADLGVVNADATLPYDYDPTITAKTITLAFDRVNYAGDLDTIFLTEDTEEGCNFTVTVGQDKYYTNDLFDAIACAPANATVTFNKDYYIVTASHVAIIDKAITIDLNGKTLGVSQSAATAYFLINTTETVTINGNNGMIVASDNKNISTATYGRGYPIFRTSKAVNLVLNNVNTCTGAIFYQTSDSSNGAKLTVNGGEHYGIYLTLDTYSRGLVATRANSTVVFNDAKIYMTYMNSLAYSVHSDSKAETKLSTYTYNNCYIVQQGDTHSLIRNANTTSYFYFNGSYVYGLFAQEKSKGTYTGANIIFGEGSFWGSSGKAPDSGNYNADVNFTAADFVIAEGYNAYAINSGIATPYTKFASGDFLKVTTADKFNTSDNTFKTGAQNGAKYTYSLAVLNASDIDVEYVKGGKTYYAVLDDNFKFTSVIENAEAGTTIKLHDDVCLTGLGTIAIKKSLTIDLNGKTMSAENSGQNYIFKIDASDVNFTLANGTLTYKHAGANTTHAFMDVYASLTGVVVNFNNLTTYTGMLLRSYAGQNVQVNINGGEHHLIYQPTNLTTSYIESRANMTLTANGAKFYLGGYSLFASCSYKQSGDKASSFTYINCQILQTAADKHVVQYANNHTTATFDNCKIYGKIQPAKNGWDSNDSNPTAGSFKLINGTTYIDGASFNTAVDVSTGYKIHNVSSSLTFDFANDDYDATIEGTTVTISNTTDGAWYKVVNGGVDYYYSFPEGTKDSLKTVIGYAGTDSDVTDDVATLVLLKDIEINISASLTISKNLTIDLGGHTLYIEQGPVYNDKNVINGSVSIVTSKSVKFMNGTIMLAANSEYGNNKTDQKVSAIVQPSSGAKIYFKDVNTYGYAITYSWGNAYSVYVDGGEHHVNAKGGANMSYVGWICGGNNITAEVKNATVYLENTAAYLVTLSHYKAGDTKSSVATFDNCTIVASSATHNIIPNMNNATKITFTNSDIFGKIDPTAKPGMDSSASVKAEKGAIVIGAGCRISDNVLGGVVVLANGVKLYDKDFAEALTCTTASSLWNLEGFALSTVTKDVTFNLVDVTTVTGVDFVFEYVKGGITYWTPEVDTQTTFNNLFSDADKGSTIKLLHDYTWTSTATKYVQKDIILDLNGFTLTHQQSLNGDKNYAAGFLCLQNGTFTIKNGTIRLALLDGGVDTGKNYPFIRMDHSSAVTKNVVLNIENVNTYGGTFIYNQTILGATINVTGGEHYLINGYQNVSGAFIESRTNSVVTVTGAKFYISDKIAGLVVSMSYKQTTEGVDKASSFVFTDCEIYAATATKNIIPNSNKFTTFEFNNCKIVGSIAPSLHSFDGKVDVPTDGSIVFGVGTTYISGSKLNLVISNAAPAMIPDAAIEIAFADPTYGTKTASGTVLKVGYTPAGEVTFSVIVNGETLGEYATLDAAIAAAPAGATIKLLRDLTIDAYGIVANIDKALTIDLDGKHLTIIQHAQSSCILITTGDKVVITNGRLSSAAGAEYRKTLTTTTSDYDVGAPIFATASVAIDLTLNGVSTYSPGIIYNTASGSKFTVIGGYHRQISITYPEATYISRGNVISKANITVLFQGASIDIDWCGSLLISTAQNEASAENALSTFTYEGCTVNYTGGKNDPIIRAANAKTFVYFKDSDIYGAFVQPTNKDSGIGIGQFTSDNLHFDANCTWGYPTITDKTLITPTIAEGYSLVPIGGDATKITFVKYDITGKIHLGTFAFPETATTGNFTITYKVTKPGDLLYEVTTGGNTTYFDDTISFAQLLEVVAADSTIKFLGDVTYTSSAAIKLKKSLTFDLGGYTLTFYHPTQNNGLEVHSKIKLTFMNGNIVNAPAPGSDYETKNLAFAFIYVNASNTELVFDNVNATVSALTYAYGSSYTITITGGQYDLPYGYGGMNTAGFISGQANIDATVTGATIYVKKDGYLVGASSYRQYAMLNGQHKTLEEVKAAIKSTFIFNDCTIIGSSASKNIIANSNEFTHIEFNGCTIYGTINPSQNKYDITYKYALIGSKLYTVTDKCACETFNDTTTVDGKCDSCGKLDPNAEIKTFTVGAIPKENIVIGKGTLFNDGSTFYSHSVFGEYLVAQPVSISKNINGTPYTFNRQADYKKIIWYNEKGEVIIIVDIDANFTSVSDSAPKYEGAGGITNGWYKIGGYIANSWTDKLDGTTAIDLSKINKDDIAISLALYPQANSDKISAYLSAAMYNLSITGAIRNNFYIPATPDNVEILRVYNEKGEEIKGTLVLYREHDGTPVYYTMYVAGEVGAAEFTKVTNIYVEYKVNGSITLTQEYNLSPEKYANTVYKDSLKAEGNKYNTKAYNVVADLVRYSYLLSVYAKIDADELTAITNLYNKMSGLCTKLPVDNDMAGSTTNVFELQGTGSIAYEASSFEPRWKFTLKASAQITGIKITLDGYNNGVLDDRTNFGPKTYGVEDVTVDANGYIISAYTQNIPIYNMVQEFTITFTKADGSEISGTYDLKSYYSAVAKNTEAADFIKAVVALANSTVAYKFPEGKITTNDVADFFGCDHAGNTVVELDSSVNYGNFNFKPRFCSKCDSYLFYYEDYGAVANGKTEHKREYHIEGTNDYEAIYWTHANANEWADNANLNGGKHTAVVGNSDPSVDKNYYISLPEGRGIYEVNGTAYKKDQNLGSITIATDTSWNGVNLLIDDDAICNNVLSNYDSKDTEGKENFQPCDCGRKHAYTNQSIFVLNEYGNENNDAINFSGKITSLSAGATNIGFAPGRKMLIRVVNNNQKIFLRYGSNASSGAAVDEVLLVDEFGNIDPTTPVQWDYTEITTLMGYSVDTTPIKVSGLDSDGNINSEFETYVNNDVRQYLYHFESCTRNISIQRSNATVEGIYRYFLEEPAKDQSKGDPNGNDRMSYTFIHVTLCNNATIYKMSVINHNSQAGDSGTGQGSYEFNGSDANVVNWIECETRNMFSNASDGSLRAYAIYRGLFGTNRIRNMYLNNCYLNSFDSHSGAHNVTIENSTFDHMNFIGGGDIVINNVQIYTASNYGSAINLRTDYGSTWKGDLKIDGLTILYGIGSKPSRITLIYGAYENQYWGFDTYSPQNVTINNFHIQAYTAVVENGERTETLGATDDPSMKVYYYYGLHDLDSVPAESVAGKYDPTGKLINENAKTNYGTNHHEVTKNLTITNSVSMTLPLGKAWHKMNVTIDGATWAISEKKIAGFVYGYEWKKK